MKEILPDIYTWHEFSEEKQLNFNGYLYIFWERIGFDRSAWNDETRFF